MVFLLLNLILFNFHQTDTHILQEVTCLQVIPQATAISLNKKLLVPMTLSIYNRRKFENSKLWQSSTETYSELYQICEMGLLVKVVNGFLPLTNDFCKKLHLRCLTWFWIRLWGKSFVFNRYTELQIIIESMTYRE